MATLTIRDLDDEFKAQLRVRAARHGRSMEAEVREILRTALATERVGYGLGTRVHQRFANVPDASLEQGTRTERARPAELRE